MISSGQVHHAEKSFYPIYAIYPHILDSATNTVYIYDDSASLVCTIALIDTTQLYRRVTFYYANKNKSWQFSEKNQLRCDTMRQWTENGKLHGIEIYSDTDYVSIDFSENGNILQMGTYSVCRDTFGPYIIRDSTTFDIYEAGRCDSDYFVPSGVWYTFHENGTLESEGRYLPREFGVMYPTVDSAGIAVVVKKTSFDMSNYSMGITCSTQLKDGTWLYYNDQGNLTWEEYYEGGLLRNSIQY